MHDEYVGGRSSDERVAQRAAERAQSHSPSPAEDDDIGADRIGGPQDLSCGIADGGDELRLDTAAGEDELGFAKQAVLDRSLLVAHRRET